MTQRSKRTVISALIILAILVVICFWKQTPTGHSGDEKKTATIQQRSTNTGAESDHLDAKSPQPPESRHSSEKLSSAADGKNVPINFWGKVVDQNGTPLEGVRISASIRRWSPASLTNPAGSFEKREAISNNDGTFEITGGRGDLLTIEDLQKENYEPEPSGLRSFGYNISTNIIPNPERPIVFRMWKDDVRHQLISGDKFVSVQPDGRVYTFNFINGTISEGGDANGHVRLALKRAPEAAWGQKYDWSFRIEAMDGSLREEPDRYDSMYLAPDAGYSNALTAALSPNDDRWGFMLRKRLYVKSGEGFYGRVDLEIYPYYLKDKLGRFSLKYTFNTNGSRVLRGS